MELGMSDGMELGSDDSMGLGTCDNMELESEGGNELEGEFLLRADEQILGWRISVYIDGGFLDGWFWSTVGVGVEMGLLLTKIQSVGFKIMAHVIGGTMRFEASSGLVEEKTGWGFVLKRGSKE
eukprot:9213258-Ditylum_brightwellii.AAC.1